MARGPGRRAAPAPLSLEARALALLAQRDQSEAELRRKLARHLQRAALPRAAGAAEAGAAGPAATGPEATGHAATGPELTGPELTGPELTGPAAGPAATAPQVPGAAPPGADARSGPPFGAACAAERIEAVLARLRERGDLSESRFVESRVHHREARYGNLRIRQELAQHGLALPADAARALQASEPERALQVWRRKFGRAPADAAERARQARFLAQRGFAAETIARVLRRAGAPDDDDPGGA